MKLAGKAPLILAAVVVVAALAFGAVFAFDLPTAWERHRAIADIKLGRDVEAARKTLMDQNDRQGVLDAIKGGLDDDGDTVDAKFNLLTTLSASYFNQPRIIDRALDSGVKETRRAAAFMLHTAPDRKDEIRDIALDWVKDESADGRSRAVLLCRRLDVREAVPVLLKHLDRAPEDQAGIEMARHAIVALGEFKAEGLGERLMALAENTGSHEHVRAQALNTLATLDDAPREKVKEMAIRLLQDKKNSVDMRSMMTGVLREQAYADDKTWYALEQIIKDPEDTDYVTQRSCLRTLANHVPLDRLRKLLLDRSVYLHPYYAIRNDVAVGLAAMNVRERVALDILAQYLTYEDTDPKWKDNQNLVRREAWISLWHLGGVMAGLTESDLFTKPPPPLQDPDRIREYLFKGQWTRIGMTKPAWDATESVAADLNRMRQIQQHYTDPRILSEIEARWERDRLAREELEKRAAEGGPDGPAGPGDNVGPMPPKDDTPEDDDGR